jgi:hypothetical protein
MIKYIEHADDGTIIKFGVCSEETFKEMSESKKVLEVSALTNDLDRTHRIVNGKLKSKTPEEIELSKPPIIPPTPLEKLPAMITNEQYQNILKRLDSLETTVKIYK